MKNQTNLLRALVVTGCVMFSTVTVAADAEAQIAAARQALKADRQATVAEALQLTEAEAPKFWPVYHQYRANMEKVGDGLKYLVIEYANLYPDVSEVRAQVMLKQLSALETEAAETRARYLKRVAKVLPPTKALRFAQVENRLDLAVRLELAATIPLVPVEGKISGQASGAAAIVAGKVGGTLVETVEFTAKVIQIDRAARKLTLLGDDNIKQTVKLGSDAINFEQVAVGDRVTLTATEELVVKMVPPGRHAEDEAAAVVALAPKGAKPGGVIADSVQITARVTAIDRKNSEATVQFEDGTTKTFPVRSDIDLSKHRVGDQVVFQITEMVALTVKRQ